MNLPTVDFHTAFGMTALSGWALMGVLWLIGRQYPKQGVEWMMASSGLFGVGYFFIVASVSMPFKLAMGLAYFFVGIAIAAVTLGMRRFLGLRVDWRDVATVALPFIFTALVQTVGRHDFNLVARLSNTFFLVQMGLLSYMLVSLRRKFVGNGWKVLLSGMGIQALTLIPVALMGRSAAPPLDEVSNVKKLVLWLICVAMFLNLHISIVGYLMLLLDRRNEGQRQAAEIDPLTQLHNRRGLTRYVDRRIAQWAEAKATVGVFVIDIDNFKRINDRFGHDVGDRVLRHVGDVLSARARALGFFARLGGEEFLLIAPNVDMEGAEQLSADMVEAVRLSTLTVDEEEIRVTVSIGAHVLSPQSHKSVNAAMRKADAAMYSAKRNGRDQFVLG